MDLLLRLDFFAANVTNEGSARTSHLVATRFLDELLPASLPRTGPGFGVQNSFLYLETPLRLVFLFDLFAPQRNVGFLPALSTRFEFASSNGTAEYHFRLWQFSLVATFWTSTALAVRLIHVRTTRPFIHLSNVP